MRLLKIGFKILQEEGIIKFTEKFLRYVKNQAKILLFPYALFRIKSFPLNSDLCELIDFAFEGLWGLFKPSQIQYEVLRLVKNLRREKSKVIIEIGTAKGGTLFLLSQAISEDATIISIDLPGGEYGGGYPKWRIPLYKAFARRKQKIRLIRANSHSSITLEKVKFLLNNKYVDFLFIDGDHSYYGVKKDFEMYGPLVRKGGIIAFHDIVSGPKENVGDVPEFWKDIRDDYESKEIVEDWEQNGYGIGIIYYRVTGEEND